MNLPEKLRTMTAYEPVIGNYAVRLDANESFLPLPDWLQRDILSAVEQTPLHRYPDPWATGVRQLAAERFGVDAALIVAGNGSDELIGLIMASMAPRCGRVLLTDPDFSMYRFYAELFELTCHATGKIGRRPDVDAALREAERRPPDLVILSNPCNPTGLGAPRAEILRLVGGVDCPVVVDEAYMDFWDQSIIDQIPKYENLLILKTCSKAIGLAGLRLGFALAGPEIIGALQKTKSPYNVNVLTQAIGETVLSHPDYLRDCENAVKTATAALFKELCSFAAQTDGRIAVLPTQTNFVLLQTKDAQYIYESLRNRGVLIRKLSDDMLRVTAGSASEQKALFSALEEFYTLTEEGLP